MAGGVADHGYVCRNASENPAGIETSIEVLYWRLGLRRNASENPAGIETLTLAGAFPRWSCRNASENPAGIETGSSFDIEVKTPGSQRIRKPSRD